MNGLPIIEHAVQVVASSAESGTSAGASGADSGTSVGEIVAIVLAAASFVISLSALYVTALKKAKIGIHQTTADRPWRIAGWSGLIPSNEIYVMVALYAHNAGANAGILEDVQAAADSTLGGLLSQSVSWYPVKTSPETQASIARAQLPQGIDAGEIEELFFVGPVGLSLTPIQRLDADDQADIEREEVFARQLHDATSLPVTITWRYARPAGLVRNRPPRIKAGTLTTDVPVAGLRDLIVASWQRQAEDSFYKARVERLVSIATMGQAPL